MLLKLKNVGKIHEESEIEFDGITVLAGENGTGKSTVGKSLFSMFNTFYNLEEQIYNERLGAIERTLLRARGYYRPNIRNRVGRLATDILEENGDSIDWESINRLIRMDEYTKDLNGDQIDELCTALNEQFGVSDDSITKELFNNRLAALFGRQIGNVKYPDEDSWIELIIKNQSVKCGIHSSETDYFQLGVKIARDATYIGDSYTIDCLAEDRGFRMYVDNPYSYSRDLIWKIVRAKEKTAIDDVILKRKIDAILSDFENIGVGDLRRTSENGWMYYDKNIDGLLNIGNMSSGTKGIVLLKSLIRNGYIVDKGVLILDEPECHLHPKWQIIYAGIIVKLQKEFGLTCLISTHSTDFLGFIDYYVHKYDSSGVCRYYLVTNNDDKITSSILNVSNKVDSLYKELGSEFIRISEELEGIV